MFKNKTSANPPIVKDTQAKLEPYEIRVMPVKFHKYLALNSKGSSKFLLISVIVIFILAALSAGAYFLIISLNKQTVTPTPENENQNQVVENANTNENINTEVPVNDNENDNLNSEINVNAETNANTNANINVETNINTNTNSGLPVISYQSSMDSDADGLTDVEEDLYKTQSRRPDTDGDGYTDGQEVIGGYDPTVGGGATLDVSGFVNTYTNPVYNYQLLHLASWLARPTDSSLQEIVFQSATGEYVQILVQDNPEKQDIVNWYLSLSKLSLDEVNKLTRKTTKQGLDVLISADGLTYYLQDKNAPEKVYVMTYIVGSTDKLNFKTTLEMMVNQFKLSIPSQPVTPVEPEPAP